MRPSLAIRRRRARSLVRKLARRGPDELAALVCIFEALETVGHRFGPSAALSDAAVRAPSMLANVAIAVSGVRRSS